jgi:hypothetical protein
MRGFTLIYFSSPFLCPVVDNVDGGLEFIEAIAGPLCVANIAVSSIQVAAVVLSNVGRSVVQMRYRTGPKTLPCFSFQFSLHLWFHLLVSLERVTLLNIPGFCSIHGERVF